MLKSNPSLWWSQPSAVLRYAIAVLSIALALAVADLALVYLNDEPFVTLFLCAIMFAAWFGGFGPGLFAAALAVSTFAYLLPPINSFAVEIAELPRLILFAITALFVSLLSASQRATAESLRHSRDDLQAAIEEQRRVERTLRQSEMYLAEAQRLSRTGSFGRNVSTGEVFWSEETFRIFEVDSSVTPSVELALQRVHPDDRAFFRQLAEEASNDGTNREDEYRLLMPDGRVKYIRSLRGRAGREFAGTLTMVGTAMDVTERKQAEERLREQASLLDLTHDTIFVRDMSNVITYWNRAAEELYGWTAEEAVGRMTTHQLLGTVFPAPLDQIEAELLRTGRWEGDLLHTKRGGTQVVVASRWSLRRDEHGQPAAVLETNNDITNRKRSEEALRQAQSELAHATRVTTLGELTASIAHEVNQPLAGVVSSGNACLRWLASEPPNLEKARQSVDRIVRDANRASEVVARVRSLAKKAPLEKGWLNLNDVVLETTALTGMEVVQNRASLSTQLSYDAPPVWADRIQLQQVILNLIMNAVEAVSTVDGPRDLFISTAKHESDSMLLTVRDSGRGLDPEKIEQIFDAFYTTKPEGMGMGLAVSRSIIEAHGGRLWASANEPRGAVFQFTLPTAREDESRPKQ